DPAVTFRLAQSSFAAPVARFSRSSPLLSDSVNGSTLNERLIPDASTPSQLFVPCVIETSLKLADKPPTPPAATDVSRVRAVACALVNAGVAAASVTWPT